MKQFTSVNHQEVIELLNTGAIGILRTDTLYGVVAKADNEQAVKRVYELKGRDETKSPIVLIAHQVQMYDATPVKIKQLLNDVWPGPVSVITPSVLAPLWIRRGNSSVAYRMPAVEALRRLLNATGPLIAPSANPQGSIPATSIEEAVAYFGDQVDFYVDGGSVEDNTPSQLLQITKDNNVERLR